MRVNIYAEEITDRIEIFEKYVEGNKFTALRFYLELPVTVMQNNGIPKNVSGPFIHKAGDNDSSAVTFWGKGDMRKTLQKAIEMLDRHYEETHGKPPNASQTAL